MIEKTKTLSKRVAYDNGEAILVERALLNGILIVLTIVTAIAIGTWATGGLGALRAALYI